MSHCTTLKVVCKVTSTFSQASLAVHSVAQDAQMNHKTQYGPVHTFPDIFFFADSKISTSARIRISTQDSSGNMAWVVIKRANSPSERQISRVVSRDF